MIRSMPCPSRVTRCEGGHLHLTVGPGALCMKLQVRDAHPRLRSAQELRQ